MALPLRLVWMTDKRLMELLGKRVRQLRIERRLKQEEMCRFGFDYKYHDYILDTSQTSLIYSL